MRKTERLAREAKRLLEPALSGPSGPGKHLSNRTLYDAVEKMREAAEADTGSPSGHPDLDTVFVLFGASVSLAGAMAATSKRARQMLIWDAWRELDLHVKALR